MARAKCPDADALYSALESERSIMSETASPFPILRASARTEESIGNVTGCPGRHGIPIRKARRNAVKMTILSGGGAACTRYTSGIDFPVSSSATARFAVSINSSIMRSASPRSSRSIETGLFSSSSAITASGISRSSTPRACAREARILYNSRIFWRVL